MSYETMISLKRKFIKPVKVLASIYRTEITNEIEFYKVDGDEFTKVLPVENPDCMYLPDIKCLIVIKEVEQ